ncbi:pyruvate formate-lyase-activating enzyme [Clostridium polyendosporum]|uniref:Pyruvate formate-lyase-activating enzyme n=1 Tax=Clostridium polyendosporum TaxID=69208 RepID=A0A919VHE1_9CLOT|nr:pyruvate formate-lyase-activating protein [Clostridium polyendosporum]GIM30300.1 pyruvate formate-lyase-activating enzyme [Clostridium polyendosporum]
MNIGKIHSIESMGLVDGPGIRVVVFFQGCNLRCSYCHNPDTWVCAGGEEITPQELIKKIVRFKPYFTKAGGGVTFSGGDPLLQPDFLIEISKLCKDNGIHTTLDTSGFGIGRYEEILQYTDLILFDIKHIDREKYRELTARDIDESLKFLETAQKMNKKMWIRHVVVPGITDSEEHIQALTEMIKGLKNVEKVELLPYHLLGVNKYETMGMKYRLEGVPPMDKKLVKEWENKINEEIKLTRH